MGMQLHGLADHVGHLLEPAVIHIMQRLQDAALYRFQAVTHVRNGTLFDYIRGILHEIFIKKLMEFSKISNIFHGVVNRVDFYSMPCEEFEKKSMLSRLGYFLILYEVIHYIFSTGRGIFPHVEIKYFGNFGEPIDIHLA